jgi:hypothetical protein
MKNSEVSSQESVELGNDDDNGVLFVFSAFLQYSIFT